MKTTNQINLIITGIMFLMCGFTANVFGQTDNPCGAPALTIGASCSFTAGNLPAAMTGTGGVPAPGCANYIAGGDDVWYTMIVPASGNLTVDLNTGTLTDMGMAWYTGTCGSLSLLACDDDGSTNGLMPFINQTGLTPGSTIWVRLWDYGCNANGNFTICAYSSGGGGAPSNDNPCNAISLPVGPSCTFSTYTNAGATASAGVPAPGCASYSGGDVWFSVTVPASGNIIFDSNTGVVTDGGMAVYSGTCASLTLVACDDDNSTNGLMPMISLTGQTPGATLWVRFWEFGNNNNGTFNICAHEPGGGGATSQDCSGAIPVCTDASYPGNSNGFANQELNLSNQGCLLGDENQTTWFGFSPSSTGTVALGITPTGGAVDYDFAIWGPYPPGTGCPVTGNPIRCSFASGFTTFSATGSYVTGLGAPGSETSDGTGGTLDGWVTPLTITPAMVGQVFYLVVDNFTANATPFVLNWTLSPANILDCTPPLPVGLATFNGYPVQEVNKLVWNTSSETNNAYFIIEKSNDAVNYQELGRLEGAGNSNMIVEYELIDPQPYSTSYYRLKQVDYDNEFTYYGPITISNADIDGLSVNNVFPNPANEHFFIETYSKTEVNASVVIYNSYGQMIHTKMVNVIGGNVMEIGTHDWPNGIYVIKVTDETSGKQSVHRLVLQ